MKPVIFIVDDSPESRRIYHMVLTAADFTVMQASTGAEALELAGSLLPNLVLLDGALPDMDGIVVCEQLRASHPNLPILFLSGRVDGDAINRARAAGADRYLRKPMAPKALVTEVRGFLNDGNA